jgi:hypothetical protein
MLDYNLLVDIFLGLVVIISIGFLHEITAYMTFHWYMLVLFIPIAIGFKLWSLTRETIDINTDRSTIPEPIKNSDIWATLVSLSFWSSAIVIEIGLAGLSVLSKYQIFGRVSMDDAYIICGVVPIAFLLILGIFSKFREILPKYTKSYIYEQSDIVGIGVNLLVLIIGGWLSVKAIDVRSI